MTQTTICPQCGAVLPANAPAGICPKCLMAAGFERDRQSRPATINSPPNELIDHLMPKKSRFQFSLGKLLLLTAVAAIAMVVFQVATGPSVNQRLFNAMKTDRTVAIKFYLWLGGDPDNGQGVSSYGGNPLHGAVLDGDTIFVKHLLNAGTTVNCFEKDGFTPIVYAADRGHWEIVKMLFEAGADHRATGADGQRVVDDAMAARRDDIVKLLTSESFPPNYWSVESLVTPLDEDRDGLPCNRVWQVFPTDRVDADHWSFRGGVRRYTAMVETDADGNEHTIHGVTSIRILDDQNWIEVTYADAAVALVPL